MTANLNTLRVNHSVARRNAGYAALANATGGLCSTYGSSGHRFAYVREDMDGTEHWECPCGTDAVNAREAHLPLMTEDDPEWEEMTAYAAEFRPRLNERVIPPHTHHWVVTDARHHDTGEWVQRCTTCGWEV